MARSTVLSHNRRVSRRTLLRAAALGGSGLVGAYLVGCGDGDDEPAATSTVAAPTATQPAATPGSTFGWQQLSPAGSAPARRRDHSLVAAASDKRQWLLLFGGVGSEGELADLWRYDITGDEWTQLGDGGPSARHGHNAAWDGPTGRMLIFGGQSGNDFFNDLWQYETETDTWTELSPAGPVPPTRYGAASARRPNPADVTIVGTPEPPPTGADGLPGQLVVSHGFTNSGRLDDTWRYDIETGAWTDISPEGERPIKRCLLRGVWDTIRDRLVVYGGQSTSEPYLGDLWTLSDSGWSELARQPNPGARNLYAMVFSHARRQMLLFGGRTAAGPTNDLWLFDAHNEFWTAADTFGGPPSPRYSHDAAWAIESGSLFVFGGTDGSTDLNDLWVVSSRN